MKISPRSSLRAAAAMLAAMLFTLLAPWSASAGIADAVKTKTLSNGITVLVLENHKAPVATFNVFYHVGSRNEQFGKTGISHLLEHLMFRGTKKYGPEEFSNIIQENGGMDNAFTTSDYTDYFEDINKDHLEVPIALEADRMANFAPQGFDSERAVVMEERRMSTEDKPEDALDEQMRAAAFVEHPYHWPVIGWMQDIKRLTLDDVNAYHSIYYSPQNAVIVTVGDFNGDQVMKQIEEAFSGIGNGPKAPPMPIVEPEQKGERRIELRHAADLPSFEEGFHVPNLKVGADAYALEIAGEILADGKSSRLYRRLVMEKRMVIDVNAGFDMTSFDPSLFIFAAQMRPGVKTQDAMAEVDKEIAALRDHPVSADELQKAKNLEQAQFVFGQDSVFREAMLLGIYQLLGDYKQVDQYLPGIDKVTAADVQRVARKYLINENRTIGVLIPTGILPKGAMGGGLSGGQVRHIDATADEVVR
ncbi:MAG TPA: pitrilysin family protein [Candidatus Binataceae bacterium]|nr:pitrilysin family protein [Candidatus Binataceae bacterium]